MAIEGAGQHLHGGNEEAVGLGEQGDGRVEFDFHDKRYEGEARGRGESERGGRVLTILALIDRAYFLAVLW